MAWVFLADEVDEGGEGVSVIKSVYGEFVFKRMRLRLIMFWSSLIVSNEYWSYWVLLHLLWGVKMKEDDELGFAEVIFVRGREF